MKIMVVDDDGISLSLMQECLSGGGYEFMTLMSSPTEVMKTLCDTAIPYDCILLDIEMPGKDGITLCGELRKLPHYKNTPILMITKRSDHASIRKAFAKGATDYITKPFEFFEVLTRIKVAERLVQERQAALDSYLAMGGDQEHPQSRLSHASTERFVLTGAHEAVAITSDHFLPLFTFQNYLERMVDERGSKIDLIAIKIRHIGAIFENTTAMEFIGMLDLVAQTTVEGFSGEEIFIAHAGNGIFFCARQDGEPYEASDKESTLKEHLRRHTLSTEFFDRIPLEVVVGTPLSLANTSNLNFRRAAKAATARMEKRESGLDDLNLMQISS